MDYLSEWIKQLFGHLNTTQLIPSEKKGAQVLSLELAHKVKFPLFSLANN